MSKLSRLAETLIGSEIVKLGNAISERKARGEKIYNYTIGDFDPKIFSIPTKLEELIIASYKENNTNYPAAEGVIELRNAVKEYIVSKGINVSRLDAAGFGSDKPVSTNATAAGRTQNRRVEIHLAQ